MKSLASAKKRKPSTRGCTAVIKNQFKDMEKLSEKQTPNVTEMRKTLVGLGNVLVQAGLVENIECKYYSSIEDFTFSCGDFHYEFNVACPYNEEEYQSFVKFIEDYMKERIEEYEKTIFEIECSKAVMEVYLTKEK